MPTPADPPNTAAPLAHHRFDALLAALAAKTPAPGGGAAACATGALAAALAGMVVSYSVGKKDLAPHQPALLAAQQELARARTVLLTLGDEDAQAYALLNALQKLPETDPRKAAELPAASLACVQIPLACVAVNADLLRLMERLSTTSNRHLRSDLAIAALLADAAARAGAWNVRINLPLLPDESARAARERELAALLEICAAIAARVQAACAV
jgi:formiminotetrahydrofolate cyclodeaminase